MVDAYGIYLHTPEPLVQPIDVGNDDDDAHNKLQIMRDLLETKRTYSFLGLGESTPKWISSGTRCLALISLDNLILKTVCPHKTRC